MLLFGDEPLVGEEFPEEVLVLVFEFTLEEPVALAFGLFVVLCVDELIELLLSEPALVFLIFGSAMEGLFGLTLFVSENLPCSSVLDGFVTILFGLTEDAFFTLLLGFTLAVL